MNEHRHLSPLVTNVLFHKLNITFKHFLVNEILYIFIFEQIKKAQTAWDRELFACLNFFRLID